MNGSYVRLNGLMSALLLLTQKPFANAVQNTRRGGAAGSSKLAVQERQTRNILGLAIAAITFNSQPVEKRTCALRQLLTRENDKVTCVFNSDIGQSDKHSLV